MRRVKVTLEYDGMAFHGWQKQTNSVALQNILEEKLAILFRGPVKVEGSSRTDAGVHARGQVIAFNVDSDKPLDKIRAGMNGLLPQAVRAREIEEMPLVFDPRRDTLHKSYRYTWYNHPVSSPFWRRYSWHVQDPMDVQAMNQAASCLVGEHDFSSFRAAACSAKSPVRRVLECQVVRDKERVQLRIQGQAFLHQMVRIIAGTLHDVGTGAIKPGQVQAILDGKNRKLAGKTAPAEGLILWEVAYGQIPRPGRKVLTARA
jgi:tRNA pseudouridine38-40 synthase